MLLVIPSINISQGVCCDCIQGAQGTERYYQDLSNDIISLIKLLRNENSKSIHITDVDSFSRNTNQLNINSISYISQTLDIPIQVFQSSNLGNCLILLKNGVQRIIIDKADIFNLSDIQELFNKFGSTRIVLHLFQKELIETPNFSLYDFFQYVSELGANRIVFTLINNYDLKLSDLVEINQLALESKIKITLNNGITNSTQLINLVKSDYKSIDSIILGKQLFNNIFPCQKVWRMVEQKIDANI